MFIGIQPFTLIFPNDKYTLTQLEPYKFTRTVLQQDHSNSAPPVLLLLKMNV